jgi:hypothetical protein
MGLSGSDCLVGPEQGAEAVAACLSLVCHRLIARMLPEQVHWCADARRPRGNAAADRDARARPSPLRLGHAGVGSPGALLLRITPNPKTLSVGQSRFGWPGWTT